MKKLLKTVILLVIGSLIYTFLFLQSSYGRASFIFKEYINLEEVSFKENGIKASFKINTTFKEFFNSYTKNGDYESIKKDEKLITLLSSKTKEEIIIDDQRIIINITSEDSSVSTLKMKNHLMRKVALKGREITIYEYYKFSISKGNKEKIRLNVVNKLREKNATNVEMGEVVGGNVFSIVANSGDFCPLVVGTKEIDLNISFASYDKSDYVIIGTPLIPVSY